MNNKSCHVMVKPIGSKCNLNCEYCYYLDKSKMYGLARGRGHLMSDDTLRTFIREYINFHDNDVLTFSWQGGEPTLTGIDFFKKVISYQKEYANGKLISNTLQTNGFNLSLDWLDFFKRHNFLLGISIDGPAHIHDKHRRHLNSKSTHSSVMSTIEDVKKFEIEFNTLSVISDYSSQYPLEVYSFLKNIGSKYMQFIPLVERYDSATSPSHWKKKDNDINVTSWSVSSKEYGDFISEIFLKWCTTDIGDVFIPLFESFIGNYLDVKNTNCFFSKSCCNTFAMESNGDIYQCDHNVDSSHLLGNIHYTSLDSIVHSQSNITFGANKLDLLSEKCTNCKFLKYCNGGCLKHRFKNNENYLCDGYQYFFTNVLKKMEIIASCIKAGKSVDDVKLIMKCGGLPSYRYTI